MKQPRTWVIIADRNGQLGNRLIVFSHFMAVAFEKGFGIINPFFEEYASYFEFAADRNTIAHPFFFRFCKSSKINRFLSYLTTKFTGLLLRIASSTPWYKIIRIYSTYDAPSNVNGPYELSGNDFNEALKKRIVLVQGWKFRAHQSVEKYSDQIRAFFRLAEKYDKRVIDYLKKLREENAVLIGVHIRRGDYRSFENGRYFYSMSDYRDTILQLKKELFKDRKIIFMVCSNEEISEKEFEGITVRKGPGHFVEDLYALSGCDYIIGPPSTFSHWAAFYGKIPLARITSAGQRVRMEDFNIPVTL